jgi:hypothetical protein
LHPPATPSTTPTAFKPKCLSINQEVGREDGRIHCFAAVRGDTGETITYARGSLTKALQRLDGLAEGATFLLGHNVTGSGCFGKPVNPVHPVGRAPSIIDGTLRRAKSNGGKH